MSEAKWKASILEGIRQGREVKKQEDREQRLADLFNASSALREGLAFLQGMEGGFRFAVDERSVTDKRSHLNITTNIPVGDRQSGETLSISVYSSDKIGAFGDGDKYGCDQTIYAEGDNDQVTDKILTFVARHAAKRGMVL